MLAASKLSLVHFPVKSRSIQKHPEAFHAMQEAHKTKSQHHQPEKYGNQRRPA
jgi:hypothetical protein